MHANGYKKSRGRTDEQYATDPWLCKDATVTICDISHVDNIEHKTYYSEVF